MSAIKKIRIKPSYILIFAFIAFAVSFPLLTDSRFLIRLLVEIFFFAAMGNAWNIIGGYGKQISWASATFLGIGAYSGALLFVSYSQFSWLSGPLSPWISSLIGMAIAVALAVIIGLPCFRLRGVYFAIATIACATIVRQLLIYFQAFTGGAMGIPFRIQQGNSLWNLHFTSTTPFFYIALIWMLVTVAIVAYIERHKLGYYLRAICDDQDAAESLGVVSSRVKLKAFVISAAMLSFTGTLYVFYMGFVDPNTFAGHPMAVRIAIVVILGGMGRVWGPLIGAFLSIALLQFSSEYLRDFGGAAAGWTVYGLLIVVMVLVRPNGIVSLFDNFGDRLAKLRSRISGKGASTGGDR